MKLTAIRLHNVRRFAGRGIAIDAIGAGVNVLAEANEYGKSTIFDAVHALFFQSHKGSAKPVKALQPYSKGAVTVEADVETPEGRFRLRKRWLGKAEAMVADADTGRLIAQADEADRWIEARIRGGATGPAGLLWVQQGTVEMGQGGKAGEAEKAAREDVLTSVSGEIETLTGGRRMAQVLAQCSAELDVLVTTTGRPKSGGPYAAAIAERDDLLARRDELAGLVSELRGHLDQRSTARRRLAELQDEDTAERDRRALADTEKALTEAEALAAKLDRAVLAERLAQQQAQAASDSLASFGKSLAGIAALRKRIANEQALYAEAKDKRDRAREAQDAAASAFAKAAAAHRAADAALAAARKADLARAAATRLAERRQTLTDAEAARREADEAGAQANALDVPEAALTRLDKLAEEIAALKAERRANSASIRIAYDGPGAPRIHRDGAALPDGEPVAVDGPTRFEIDGIGTLTVAPGAGAASGELEQRLAKAAQARADVLQKLGVGSPDAARVQARKAGAHRQTAALATARLETLAPKGLDALRTEVASLQAQAEDVPETADSVEALTERHRLAAEARSRAEAERDTAQTALNALETTLATSEANLARSQEAMHRDEAALGDTGDPEARLADLSSAKDAAAKALAEASAAANALRTDTPDLTTLRAAKARAESVLTRTETETRTLTTTISELNGRIGTRAEEGIEEALLEVEGRLTRAEAHVAGLETERAALQRLKTVLTEARAEAKEHFFEPVMAELRPLLSIVFDDATVTFDETTLLPVSVERGGEIEKFDVLSGGMREQITILTRLAFARLLAEDGRTVPVILDDALIYSDDARIERMFDALHRQATDLQILVFTCRQRAFRALGGREMQVGPWSPE